MDNIITANGTLLPQTFSGNCIYAALGARVWSESVGVVSRYGAGYSEEPLELLRSRGIDTTGIRHRGVPHGRNVAFAYRADGSRTREIPPELLARIPLAERARFFDTTLLPDADAQWHLSAPDGDDVPLDWWDGIAGVHCAFMPVRKHVQIAEMVRRRRGDAVWVQVDSPWHDACNPDVDYLTPLMRVIDALLPSEADLDAARPGASIAETTRVVLDAGAKTIVLKLGPAGCRVFTRDAGLIAEIPAVDVIARDPTGAGDAFCGGFLAGMHETNDVVTAARYGAVAASFAVEAPGLTALAASSRREADARLRSITTPRP
jgi:ribokinase